METRKVQFTGGSSYIITLPKEWVKANNINKNAVVGVMEQGDGSLVITPNLQQSRKTSAKVIWVDEDINPTFLFRQLIAAYVTGFSLIEVRSKKRLHPTVRDCVMRFTQASIGPEILEESVDAIIVKNLLDPTEMPFERTVKRIYIIVRTMHEDAINAILEGETGLLEGVEQRDYDVDRLHWLVARQANMVFGDQGMAKNLNVSSKEASYFFLMGRTLERIGDHAVRIARNAPYLIEGGIGAEARSAISKASEKSLEIFDKSMEAWVMKDIGEANRNIDSVHELVRLCEELSEVARGLSGPTSIALSYIGESIRRTGEYSADISEMLMNQIIEEA